MYFKCINGLGLTNKYYWNCCAATREGMIINFLERDNNMYAKSNKNFWCFSDVSKVIIYRVI